MDLRNEKNLNKLSALLLRRFVQLFVPQNVSRVDSSVTNDVTSKTDEYSTAG